MSQEHVSSLTILRTLDIDILLYDREIIMEEKLIIPHIEMSKREFVLKPLCEIAPFAYHPGFNKTVMELYDILKGDVDVSDILETD